MEPCSRHECRIQVFLSKVRNILWGKRGCHQCMRSINHLFIWVNSWSHMLHHHLLSKIKDTLCLDRSYTSKCLGNDFFHRLDRESAKINKIIIITIIILIVIIATAILLRRVSRTGLTIAAQSADVWYFNWTVITHARMCLLQFSFTALNLWELSNSWNLEKRITATINWQIIQIITSFAPRPTLLTSEGTIEAWKSFVSL